MPGTNGVPRDRPSCVSASPRPALAEMVCSQQAAAAGGAGVRFHKLGLVCRSGWAVRVWPAAGACTRNARASCEPSHCVLHRVLVHWRDDSAHYPAVIDDYDQGRYHLLYDDGYVSSSPPPSPFHVVLFLGSEECARSHSESGPRAVRVRGDMRGARLFLKTSLVPCPLLLPHASPSALYCASASRSGSTSRARTCF